VSYISRRRLLHGVGTLGVALATRCAPAPFKVAPTLRLRRIGFLSINAQPLTFATFQREMRELGYVEDRDFVSEVRNAEGVPEQLPALASDLVRIPVDVIVTPGVQALLAAKAATSTIPVVFANATNLVRQGIVADLARPGGNVTGVTSSVRIAKHLELLRDAVPGLVRVAHLGDSRVPDLVDITRHALEDSEALRLVALPHPIRPDELGAALQSIERERPEALFLWLGKGTWGDGGWDRILTFAVEHHLPQMCTSVLSARNGALMGMSVNADGSWRIVARQVDRVLKGANPGELPVEENPDWEVVLSQSMARKIGFTFPPSVLRRATEVLP
jgi:putative ABC transport system substrate-binding protein